MWLCLPLWTSTLPSEPTVDWASVPCLKSVVVRRSPSLSANPFPSHLILIPTTNQLIMSSFHTTPHAAYWSHRQDKTVEGAGHEPAATTFYGSATNTSSAVSLDLLQDTRGYSLSQAQDLDWIFAPVPDDLLPNGNVGLGDLGATSAGVFNPTFIDPQSVQAAHGQMNAVCTHHLFFNSGCRFKMLRFRTSPTLGSHQYPVGYILPWICLC
jgi:hypothetical protein